ncbi:hypothetical protein TVAG_430740 [Trichomonas vaginalis G3]|uniref:YdhG-like domain-containing protein n=1 Tax=Trichomonas vaginalis (strain ATCC PRA-98 / G3) TaxID=412133 RepID=A2E398_TRIV3|nr:protein of unknown function (DUF1801) [Trichomonas vaginalis G3]EAY12908.1 hypothetical protein TVAG_430740 [Trichomonas vaginalis G3]KAI5491921.1 protein of unknown function (DUF1801) [Trichomonas vaginalis G3]|eukprot:XP_001325131.1 hypothetical protein [Trichomonas vaginalis G3]
MSVKGNRQCHPASKYSEEVTKFIDEYDGEAKEMMLKMRAIIHSCNDEISEKISWQMPTFVYHGNLVHFCPAKKHMGFYPTPSAITEFADRLSNYHTSKGAVQFPYNSILPEDLIKDMVNFGLKENAELAQENKKKRCCSKSKE